MIWNAQKAHGKEGGTLKLYLKQNTGSEDSLFTVYDIGGVPLYNVEAEGGLQVFSGQMNLLNMEQKQEARIVRMGLSTISTYTITMDNKEKARVMQNLVSQKMPYRILSPNWKFRGCVQTRSFDVLDADENLVMSHGLCWDTPRNCFSMEIHLETEVPLCISIAAIIDSAALCGTAVPLTV